MSVYLITWDLNKEGVNYSVARKGVLKQIEALDHIKDDGLDSVVFVSTLWSVKQVFDHVRAALDDDDCLFVTQIEKGGHQGWMSKSTWSWINNRL